MELDEETRGGFGVALNESDLLGLEVDPARRIAAATFRVLTLPESGPPPEDRRVQVLFHSVERVVASLREGVPDAETVVPFELGDLLEVVRSFGGLPIYGWDFIDVADATDGWRKALSLDWSTGAAQPRHSITVFQEGTSRLLDVSLWFDWLEIRTPDGSVIPMDAFIAGGRRWWDAFHRGDPRTDGFGLQSLRGGN